VGHESEIEQRGAYRRRTVAGRPLFIVRGRDDRVRVLYNTCAHRGAVVCRRDEGVADVFQCFYHGWTYSNSGDLVATPDEAGYAEGFDRSDLGLRSPPHVDAYRGMWFVSFAEDAEPLEAWLDGARHYIDLTMDSAEILGGWTVMAGTAKYAIKANWKLLVENSMDSYHLPTVHQTYLDYMAGRRGRAGAGRGRAEQHERVSRGFALANGHSGMLTNTPGRPIATPSVLWSDEARVEVRRIRALLADRFGEDRAKEAAEVSRHLSIFPNVAFQDSHTGFRIRQWWPVAPDLMEVTQWEFVPRQEREDIRAYRMQGSLAFLGPGGFATPDDVEALESCQQGFHARGVEWSDISRGMDRDPLASDELQMRGFWRQWHALIRGLPSRASTSDATAVPMILPGGPVAR
jgi:p-cumate 2,3-dioxygenase alpha subunit